MFQKIGQFVSFFVLSLFVLVSPAFASVLYFKPLGGDMTPNQNFPVEIHLKTTDPEPVTSASVYFTYPQDKVEIVSVKPGSRFPVNLGNSYSNGTFAMTRNNVNGVSGDVVVATVNFRPKVANTSVMLNFIDGIKASQSDNTDTLDTTWTKNNIAQFNIKEGKIISSAPAAQGGVGDELPKAGLFDNTLIMLGVGFGSLPVSGLGLYGSKKYKTTKNTIS